MVLHTQLKSKMGDGTRKFGLREKWAVIRAVNHVQFTRASEPEGEIPSFPNKRPVTGPSTRLARVLLLFPSTNKALPDFRRGVSVSIIGSLLFLSVALQVGSSAVSRLSHRV